jgi:hypothetical protein
MGRPKRRKHKIQDLNPSLVAQNKSCKGLDEEPGRTPSLEKVSLATTIA